MRIYVRRLLFSCALPVLSAACGAPQEDAADATNTPDAAAADAGSDVSADLGIDSADMVGGGLSGAQLIEHLRNLTSENHTALGYNTARDHMYAAGGIDDRGGRIEGIYTGRTVATDGSRTPGTDCRLADGASTTCAFNTEHTFARIHLRDVLTEGTPEYFAAEGDLHHIFPSDEGVNGARWHFDFGTTDCRERGNCKLDEGSQLGLPVDSSGDPGCPTTTPDMGTSACVMQVRPDRRGDVARAQFYMSIRYGLPIPDDAEETLRSWDAEDAPDAVEIDRNDAIEAAQGNRNPFVDEPGLADRIDEF